MKTVTICGSMKFEKEMQRIAFLLETKHDLNVLQCIYNTDAGVENKIFKISIKNMTKVIL